MISFFLKFGLVVDDPNCHSFGQGSTVDLEFSSEKSDKFPARMPRRFYNP